MSIYTKLFEIQKKNILLKADSENPFFHSKYVSIENIMTTLKPLLQEQGLLVLHSISADCVTTQIVETDEKSAIGTAIQSCFPINKDLDAQKIGAMVTYGKRYNLVALFALIEDDDDGNSLVKNAPISNDVPQMPTKYPKSALDEVMEQMEVENDLEHLKTLYALGLDKVKSDKQRTFFDNFKEKQKKRILSLNIHTA